MAVALPWFLVFTSLAAARGGDLPFVKVRPDALSFADQLQATTSNPLFVTITNQGSGPLKFAEAASVRFSDNSTSGEFSVSQWNCPDKLEKTGLRPDELASGESCTVGVVFTPVGSGARTATLEIKDNASDSPQHVALSGNGTSTLGTARVKMLSFSSTAFSSPFSPDFGDHPQTSETPDVLLKEVGLENAGTEPITITDVFLGGYDPAQFFISKLGRHGGKGDTCSHKTLAAHESCRVYIGFHPTRRGVMSAILKITDNAPDSPQQAAFAGRAPPTAIGKFNKTSMLFTQHVGQKSAEQGVRITNVGDAPLVITEVVFSHYHGAQGFAISDDNCKGKTLAPISTDSCRVYLTWTPPAKSENHFYPKYSDLYAETTLQIESPVANWSNYSHDVRLEGKLRP